jgi:uncharacterized SAM-binding protein YcdF (DUF218 family)
MRAAARLAAASIAGGALLSWGELHAWQASRQDYPAVPDRPAHGDDVVLVLGFPPRRDGMPGALQRWRTRIAVRSAPPGALFVFSGAAVHGDVPEAVVMAAYGRALGIRPDRIARETRARTTRENLAFARPWLEGARSIRIASNTFHARRARRYLRETEPELWRRLARTRDFVLLELGPLRLALTFYDAVAARAAASRGRL